MMSTTRSRDDPTSGQASARTAACHAKRTQQNTDMHHWRKYVSLDFEELIQKWKLPKSTPVTALRALQTCEADAVYWKELALKVVDNPVWWVYDNHSLKKVGVSASRYMHRNDLDGHEFSIVIDYRGLSLHVNGHQLLVSPRAHNAIGISVPNEDT